MLRNIKKRLSRNDSSGGRSVSSNGSGVGVDIDLYQLQQQQLQQQQHQFLGGSAGEQHHQHQQQSKFQAAGKALGSKINSSLVKHLQSETNQSQQRRPHHPQNHLQAIETTTAADTLSRFDGCIEAADAQLAADAAAVSSSSPSGDVYERVLPPRSDPKSGINDCSVLVSPDGDLLLVPHNDTCFRELMLNGKDDYESAVFLGNDLKGDAALNGFSAVGWSIPAATAALKQTQLSLRDYLLFTENLVLSKKEDAARIAVACNDFRLKQPSLGGVAPDWELLDVVHTPSNDPGSSPTGASATLLPSSPNRVGPLCMPQSTVNRATVELEKYYSNVSELESQRWRRESSFRKGCLVALREASEQLADRCQRRDDAIEHTAARARRMEDELNNLRHRAEKAWDAVYNAEESVTQRIEVIMQKRSREREKLRLEQIKQQHDQAFGGNATAVDLGILRTVSSDSAGSASITSPTGASNTSNSTTTTPTLGATNEEIWNLVSAVAESMDGGSFEPMELPDVPLSVPKDKSMDEQDDYTVPPTPPPSVLSDSDRAATGSSTGTSETNPQEADPVAMNATGKTRGSASAATAKVAPPIAIPVASREQIELEVGLPHLRMVAMASDELVADAADALMNLLSSMDTTRRSARVAAETSLLSACNAQAACIKSMAKLERESLEQRLKELEALEETIERIDVRSDLNAYITSDKRERGGLSPLGDDDDGGIASALAILSRHVDGSLGYDASFRMSASQMDDESESEHDEGFVAEMLDQTLEFIFSKQSPTLNDEVEKNLDILCNLASDCGPSARAKRAKISYALNSKRSSQAEIASQAQYDSLCKLFSAILTGCNTEEGGVSNAKMCIMLAQTFYMASDNDDASESDHKADNEGGGSPARNRRVYVKNSLRNHPLWEKDDFW